MEYYNFLIISLCALFYTLILQAKELQMLQQNSYRNTRYLKWLKKNALTFSRICDIVLLVFLFVLKNYPVVFYLAAIYFLIKGIVTTRKKSKKPLVFTARAKRLYGTSIVLIIIITLIAYLTTGIYYTIICLTAVSVLSCGILLVSNILLIPCEKSINRWYYNDAKRILNSMPDLTIIGITGSYGKTSTKHFLHTILSEKYNVLMTPGSYNTTLGVIRTIREQLKSYHNIFIVEMGAKQIGDIKEICDLVNPSIGIITAIGEQHLETFKTITNIQKTKFELIDALPQSGLAVINNDFEYIVNRKVDHVKQVLRYSYNNPKTSFYLNDINYDFLGSHFSIQGKVTIPDINAHVLGEYNLSNILAATIVALHLNMTIPEIRYGIHKVQPVEHRLSIRHMQGDITILDDAFNSNPYGSAMALNVIRNFKNQRIIITPGMIELGTKQYFYNNRLGQQIAESCDYAIIVGKYNQEAIVSGLKEKNFPEEKYFLAANLNEAVKQMQTIVRKGDVVLYENDLPDTFK